MKVVVTFFVPVGTDEGEVRDLVDDMRADALCCDTFPEGFDPKWSCMIGDEE